jgi:hypothetical protein
MERLEMESIRMAFGPTGITQNRITQNGKTQNGKTQNGKTKNQFKTQLERLRKERHIWKDCECNQCKAILQ